MERTTIPLILPSTARGWAATVGTSAKDQQLINGLYQVSQNTQAGSKTVYAQKRAGSTDNEVTIGGAGEVINLKYYGSHLMSSFYISNSSGTIAALYDGSDTLLGTLGTNQIPSTESNLLACDAIINGVPVMGFTTIAIGVGSFGWYLFKDAIDTNFPTFTGNRTSGSDVISGIASTTGIYPGQAISGDGIPADTRVSSVDSASQITMTKNATSGTGTATTITKEALARIIDSTFPTGTITGMVTIDGYFFVADCTTGIIYQSAINDPSSWASGDTINADYSGDGIVVLFKIQNYIVAGGNNSIQYFYNAGNASGSVLSVNENLNIRSVTFYASPVFVGGDGYFPGVTVGGEGLYKISGANQIQKVSDPTWSAVINQNSLSGINPATIGGRSVIILGRAPKIGEASPLCYDPDTGEFSIINLASGASFGTSFGSVYTKNDDRTLYTWASGNTWTDSGASYTLTAQTQPYTLNDGRSVIIQSVELIADTEASGEATLYISEDDGQTWQNCGTFDMTQAIKRIDGIGWIPSSVAFRVQHSANTNFRAQALVVNWTPCGR